LTFSRCWEWPNFGQMRNILLSEDRPFHGVLPKIFTILRWIWAGFEIPLLIECTKYQILSEVERVKDDTWLSLNGKKGENPITLLGCVNFDRSLKIS